MLKLDIGELGAVLFYQFFARRFLPISWFRLVDPAANSQGEAPGRLHLHIVSHCWRYGHFLTYQLSSLVIHRTSRFDLTMTVYYSPEDEPTQEVLRFFGDIELPGITWDWQQLPKESLFRRGIGRNLTAKRSTADWIWFTDADVVFGEQCLESLAELLQDRDDVLVFPALMRATALLQEENPVLRRGGMGSALMDLPLQHSVLLGQAERAMGPYQIVPGRRARAFDTASRTCLPTTGEHWRKCYGTPRSDGSSAHMAYPLNSRGCARFGTSPRADTGKVRSAPLSAPFYAKDGTSTSEQ